MILYKILAKQNVNVMRVSAVFGAAARCCNTANSSLTIGNKNKI